MYTTNREKGLRKTWELDELNITRNEVGETRIYINGVDVSGKNVSPKPSKAESSRRLRPTSANANRKPTSLALESYSSQSPRSHQRFIGMPISPSSPISPPSPHILTQSLSHASKLAEIRQLLSDYLADPSSVSSKQHLAAVATAAASVAAEAASSSMGTTSTPFMAPMLTSSPQTHPSHPHIHTSITPMLTSSPQTGPYHHYTQETLFTPQQSVQHAHSHSQVTKRRPMMVHMSSPSPRLATEVSRSSNKHSSNKALDPRGNPHDHQSTCPPQRYNHASVSLDNGSSLNATHELGDSGYTDPDSFQASGSFGGYMLDGTREMVITPGDEALRDHSFGGSGGGGDVQRIYSVFYMSDDEGQRQPDGRHSSELPNLMSPAEGMVSRVVSHSEVPQSGEGWGGSNMYVKSGGWKEERQRHTLERTSGSEERALIGSQAIRSESGTVDAAEVKAIVRASRWQYRKVISRAMRCWWTALQLAAGKRQKVFKGERHARMVLYLKAWRSWREGVRLAERRRHLTHMAVWHHTKRVLIHAFQSLRNNLQQKRSRLEKTRRAKEYCLHRTVTLSFEAWWNLTARQRRYCTILRRCCMKRLAQVCRAWQAFARRSYRNEMIVMRSKDLCQLRCLRWCLAAWRMQVAEFMRKCMVEKLDALHGELLAAMERSSLAESLLAQQSALVEAVLAAQPEAAEWVRRGTLPLGTPSSLGIDEEQVGKGTRGERVEESEVLFMLPTIDQDTSSDAIAAGLGTSASSFLSPDAPQFEKSPPLFNAPSLTEWQQLKTPRMEATGSTMPLNNNQFQTNGMNPEVKAVNDGSEEVCLSSIPHAGLPLFGDLRSSVGTLSPAMKIVLVAEEVAEVTSSHQQLHQLSIYSDAALSASTGMTLSSAGQLQDEPHPGSVQDLRHPPSTATTATTPESDTPSFHTPSAQLQVAQSSIEADSLARDDEEKKGGGKQTDSAGSQSALHVKPTSTVSAEVAESAASMIVEPSSGSSTTTSYTSVKVAESAASIAEPGSSGSSTTTSSEETPPVRRRPPPKPTSFANSRLGPNAGKHHTAIAMQVQ
ncbi:hypothetical protein CEUSTIGMA_g1163.t1 [Chlamydomonas eustigma]|uniref:Sfi1 spindle body domain-containing protein n=1 Tax=Chlamydomonas eustigma TaxID=1157962 RepID=A0A250WT58_9CHLO|nr:hypothetical protein CEUSTIGMA_g1163.t1 [Chlamydomonas eustigma]|eukprot:GAX73710.1 hypothetical protein CEUSTIGMA_g1163.t1 [Chlamydomonas eustigma]